MTICEASARCYAISVYTAVLVTLFRGFDIDDNHNKWHIAKGNTSVSLLNSSSILHTDECS
jgi:hypothetical protein